MSVNNLFDVDCDNVHMVKIDTFEASAPITTPVLMATEKQLNFLKKLFAERSNNEEARIVRAHLLSEYKAGKLTRKMAYDAINDILSMEKDVKSPTSVEKSTELEYGQVWVSNGGNYIRIKMNQQGSSFYGMMWTGAEWKYAPGLLSSLHHQITAEEAAAWGHEHQRCVFCSKHLSDPRSEFAGYGETCARNHGLPWGEI